MSLYINYDIEEYSPELQDKLQSLNVEELIELELSNESIRLGQTLKLAEIVENGNEVKEILATENFLVNGSIETRRGRQLVKDDIVSFQAIDEENEPFTVGILISVDSSTQVVEQKSGKENLKK